MSNYSQLIHTPYFRHTFLTTLPIHGHIGIVVGVFRGNAADKMSVIEYFSLTLKRQ